MSSFASQLPDPGQPEFPAIVGALVAFLAAALTLRRSGDWDEAQRAAFQGGFMGTAAGLVVYLVGLISGL